jgi:CubicO group peptidase (beta-lactamase class C family)
MTKPIVCAAAMMLYEEGRFQLDDPISRFLPAFEAMRVAVLDDAGGVELVPAARAISFRDLMSHTSGLVYGGQAGPPFADWYAEAEVEFNFTASEVSLAEMVARVPKLPLACHPGMAWNYGISIDILGHLLEILADRPLDEFLETRIFRPLAMTDTGFTLPAEKLDRFAACYQVVPEGGLELQDAAEGSRFTKPTKLFSGGGGLVSTMADYVRFCRMMANEGALDGSRLLGRKTVEYMTTNHLPGDLAAMGQPSFSETSFEGIGFGLGVSVMLDPAQAQVIGSPGEYAWGGLAGTAFWIDPAEAMLVVLMTQAMPSSALPLRRQLRVLTYQAIVD